MLEIYWYSKNTNITVTKYVAKRRYLYQYSFDLFRERHHHQGVGRMSIAFILRHTKSVFVLSTQ